MYKAIYSYSGNGNPKLLSFHIGEKFLLLKQNENNWWLVQKKEGHIGLVPNNYITRYDADPTDFLDFIELSSAFAPLQPSSFSSDYIPLSLKIKSHYKEQIFARHPHLLEDERYCNASSSHKKSQAPFPPTTSSYQSCSSPSSSSASTSTPSFEPQLNTNPHKHHQPPPPPPTTSSNAVTSPLLDGTNQITNHHTAPKNLFLTLAAKVRDHTKVDYHTSKSTVHLILNELGFHFDDWGPVLIDILKQDDDDDDDKTGGGDDSIVGTSVNGLMDADDGAFAKQKDEKLEAMLETKDARDLMEILEKLSEVKEDSQQRSWHLHEDLVTITQLLEKLLSLLINANPDLNRWILSRDHYVACLDLVLYYQMETRSSLRLIMLDIFANICSLDGNFLSELLASVLPLELLREIKDESTDSENLPSVIIVLCMLFSTGENIPHNHYTYFNEDFTMLMLNIIESETETIYSPEIPELCIKLLLAFNLHLEVLKDNICMKSIGKKKSCKYLTEHLLLLFNRGDDPVKLPDIKSVSTNSVIKFISDIFSDTTTSNIFYTNDAKVLVDIVLRQLTDLSPGVFMRTEHLSLMQLILLNSGYLEQEHRLQELKSCLNRIYNEEENVIVDKDIIQQIYHQFSTHFDSFNC